MKLIKVYQEGSFNPSGSFSQWPWVVKIQQRRSRERAHERHGPTVHFLMLKTCLWKHWDIGAKLCMVILMTASKMVFIKILH